MSQKRTRRQNTVAGNGIIDSHRSKLAISAIDFFEQAIAQTKSAPKYAVLHLATSVELFLKCRLMAEHWTLIVVPTGGRKDMLMSKFLAGDFQSITLNDAILRINQVLPEETIPDEAMRVFSELVTSRNRIAHFFDDRLATANSLITIKETQAKVWMHLHTLLTKTWQDCFGEHADKLRSLNTRMRDHRKYLQALFESSASMITIHVNRGGTVRECAKCKFDALLVVDQGVLSNGRCCVCDRAKTYIHFECPACSSDLHLDSVQGACTHCKHVFDEEQVADAIGGQLPEGDHELQSVSVYCSECDSDSAYIVSDSCVCLRCLEQFSDWGVCGWCNEWSVGSKHESYLKGCCRCEGIAGHSWESSD